MAPKFIGSAPSCYTIYKVSIKKSRQATILMSFPYFQVIFYSYCPNEMLDIITVPVFWIVCQIVENKTAIIYLPAGLVLIIARSLLEHP